MDNIENHAAVRHFGSLNKLAQVIGLTRPALVYRHDVGKPLLTAEDCLTLEEVTGGALRREQLRPDLWPTPDPIAAPGPTGDACADEPA